MKKISIIHFLSHIQNEKNDMRVEEIIGIDKGLWARNEQEGESRRKGRHDQCMIYACM